MHSGVEQKIYKKDKKKNIILFVGSRERYKNFYNFINAYGKSKYLTNNYKVICFGEVAFKDKELNLFKKLNRKKFILLVVMMKN